MRPTSIARAEALFIASLLLVLIGTALTWSIAVAALGTVLAAVTVLIVVALPIAVLLWATRGRSRIACWLLVAWTAFSVWSVVRQLVRGTSVNLVGAITIVQIVLMVAAVALFFGRDARAWFSGNRFGENAA